MNHNEANHVTIHELHQELAPINERLQELSPIKAELVSMRNQIWVVLAIALGTSLTMLGVSVAMYSQSNSLLISAIDFANKSSGG